MKTHLLPSLALLAALALTALAAQADDAATLAAMDKAGCMACHSKDKKLVGPGGSGVFGPVPMAPNPPDKISDTDLKEAVELILKS